MASCPAIDFIPSPTATMANTYYCCNCDADQEFFYGQCNACRKLCQQLLLDWMRSSLNILQAGTYKRADPADGL
ncbi:hypothetical protein PG997_007132 [Apiospora hydei]|uniref:Uncharacterized protein n=1 Tax=Apiospora hydei TaxID=1337664 RepID=A0ABR1WQR6_9PEZI